jgi:hypothetical protein
MASKPKTIKPTNHAIHQSLLNRLGLSQRRKNPLTLSRSRAILKVSRRPGFLIHWRKTPFQSKCKERMLSGKSKFPERE